MLGLGAEPWCKSGGVIPAFLVQAGMFAFKSLKAPSKRKAVPHPSLHCCLFVATSGIAVAPASGSSVCSIEDQVILVEVLELVRVMLELLLP